MESIEMKWTFQRKKKENYLNEESFRRDWNCQINW